MTRTTSSARPLLLLLLLLSFSFSFAPRVAEAKGVHKYDEREGIVVWAAKIGSVSSPASTYRYHSLPYCSPKLERGKPLSLGQAADGNRFVATQYDIAFKVDAPSAVLCSRRLSAEDRAAFRRAVENDFYFLLDVDSLPVWGFVGRQEEGVNELWTHYSFEMEWNANRVISASVVPGKPVSLDDAGLDAIDFTYDVVWKETKVTFGKRMERYRNHQFLEDHMDIHWYSIVNSFVTVLLLSAVLGSILVRILRKDLARYSLLSDEEAFDEEESSGWKLVHGDVFRFPPAKGLFCALLGTGLQVLVLGFVVFALAFAGAFYPTNRSALLSILVFGFALTAGVAGYTSASYMKQLSSEDRRWIGNLLLTVACFCLPLGCVFAVCNSTALWHKSTSALPVSSVLGLLALFFLVSLPLTIVGGIIGKNAAQPFAQPCRTRKYKREVPPAPWYRSPIVLMLTTAFLPFTAIYTELYYVFSSMWSLKVYTVFSVLFVVFVILLLVTSLVSTMATYVLLNAEDPRWWWQSWANGAAVGIYVYAYSIWFWVVNSGLSGSLQAVFYYGYSAIVAYALALMLGYVSFRSSLAFVRVIFARVKVE